MTAYQNISHTYKDATNTFKGLAAEALGVSKDNIHRKKVPDLTRPHPETGEPITITWEPEDSVCFEREDDLYIFTKILGDLDDVTLIPNLGLNFQTATLAYVPKKAGTELDNYMLRQRFDLIENPNAMTDWERRIIKDITFGVKDRGKAIDRMELEVFRTELKLQKSIRGWRKKHKNRIANNHALSELSANKLKSGALIGLSRAAFFGLHIMPEYDAAVDYQFSIDFCRNTRPKIIDHNGKIIIDGNRFEGEGEAHGTYSNRRLSEDERVEIITASLEQLWAEINNSLKTQKIPVVPTIRNKAEFARNQVDDRYGLENAKKDNIRAEQYARPPLKTRLIQVFDGNPDQGLIAMPTPDELREHGNLQALERHAA